MIKRLFSSNVSNKINCTDCRLYNRRTKLCKMNDLKAFGNRLDENKCGIKGKSYWALDKTNLIKAEKYNEYACMFELITITSGVGIILIDYKCLLSLFTSLYFASFYSEKSEKSEKAYKEENDIE